MFEDEEVYCTVKRVLVMPMVDVRMFSVAVCISLMVMRHIYTTKFLSNIGDLLDQ